MNSDEDPRQPGETGPQDQTSASGEQAAQRLWTLLTVVVVAAGMVIGYVLFT